MGDLGLLEGLFFYYYYLVCEAIGTAATPGLLCQPRVTVNMIVEKQMECSFTILQQQRKTPINLVESPDISGVLYYVYIGTHCLCVFDGWLAGLHSTQLHWLCATATH
jgi:hypothetical protein